MFARAAVFGSALAALLVAGAAANRARADMPVAVAAPLSGPYKALGAQMKTGAEMAVADLNRAGGINGEKLKLTVADDRCDPKRAVEVAGQLIAARVRFVAGHLCSRASIPASALYARAGVVMISPGSTHPQLTEIAKQNGWRSVFRVSDRDDGQGRIVGLYLAEQFKGKPVAILHDASDYGRSLAAAVRTTIRSLGLREAMFEEYDPRQKNHSALVERMKAQDISAVFIAGYYVQGAEIIRLAGAANFAPQFLTADAFATSEFWSVAGRAAEGTMMTFQYDPRGRTPAKAVTERARKAGKTLGIYGLNTYAAFEVWAAAVRSAGSTEAGPVSDALRGRKHATAIGRIAFDANGDLSEPRYTWYVWTKGGYGPK